MYTEIAGSEPWGSDVHDDVHDVRELPVAVRPGEAAALVAAFRRAQAAEAAIRRLLTRLGIGPDSAHTVATLDADGCPLVRLTLIRR